MELITQNQQLPSTIEDLARFVLIGRDRMAAVRAEISAINRLGLAQEVRQQKLAEAQDIAEVVLDAEVKLGKLMKSELPDGRGGDRGNQYTGGKTDNADRSGKSRNDVIKELGLEGRQIRRLQQLSEYPEIVAQAKVEARESSDIVSRSFVLKKIKVAGKVEKREQKAERKDISKADESGFKLLCADITNGLPEIPDNSVDFVITDPPYPREFIPLYGHLSKVAGRVLKDGGSALVMCGQSYLPEVMNELCKHLTYHWTLCYLTPGGQSPSLWQKKTNTFWKPVVWLTKGEYTGDYIGDRITSPVNDNDKEHHKWGQSEGGIAEIVEKFTYPGQTVFDPFLGGGTTGLVCVRAKRNFIGSDIDPECISKSEARIAEALE